MKTITTTLLATVTNRCHWILIVLIYLLGSRKWTKKPYPWSPPLNSLTKSILHKLNRIELDSWDIVIQVYLEVATTEIPMNLKGSPLAYLYGMANNIIKSEYRKNRREISVDSQALERICKPEPDTAETNILSTRIRPLLQNLPDSCQKLLREFFLTDNPSEIASKLNYKNADTIYSRKKQCIDKLIEIIQKHDPWLADQIKKRKP
ncbi:MAG: sigma-70 family RNA polymerase sigma factor [Bacteroidales bacterium]|nr:sigma-70 family RNA polymerase sigma factor [Bacteroidales bacterium]